MILKINILDSLPFMIFLSKNGKIVFCNRVVLDFFDVGNIDELLAKHSIEALSDSVILKNIYNQDIFFKIDKIEFEDFIFFVYYTHEQHNLTHKCKVLFDNLSIAIYVIDNSFKVLEKHSSDLIDITHIIEHQTPPKDYVMVDNSMEIIKTHQLLFALKEQKEIKNIELGLKNINDDKIIWSDITLIRLNELSLILIQKDITEQKRTQNILLDFNDILTSQIEDEVSKRINSQKKYEYLFNLINDAIIVSKIDKNRKLISFTEVNEKAISLFGLSRIEFLNLNPEDIFPELPTKVEKSFHSKNGLEFICEIDSSIFDYNLEHMALITIRDITEKSKFEKEKKRQEQILIQQSKMAAMGEMIGAIAHQWKQPLNIIYLHVQNFIDEIEYDGQVSIENIQSSSQKIKEQVEFMNATVDDFKNFFKPSKEKKTFDVVLPIKDIYRILETIFTRLNIELEINSHGKYKTLGFPNEFKQVILNIFNNAKDILEEKKKKNGKIVVDIDSFEDKILISIKDNGGGIPENLLPNKIFEPYVSTKGENGTGIGLQISKTIIEDNLNGKIYAKNIDNGAEFIIELPKK